MLRENDYTDTCEQCDGWDIRINEESKVWDDEAQQYTVTITCQECSFSWIDYIDE